MSNLLGLFIANVISYTVLAYSLVYGYCCSDSTLFFFGDLIMLPLSILLFYSYMSEVNDRGK